MAFAPEYTALVLGEHFEDAKALLLRPLLDIHYAHLVMLSEQRIVSSGDAHAIRCALDAITLEQVRQATYDGSVEDMFFYVERLLRDTCGADVAGRLHTARSRNDVDMTMYRMRLREYLLDFAAAVLQLRRTLAEVAGAHRDTVFAAHTHTQPAQPTTIAHYLLGVLEQLERDTTRLRAAYATTNRNPLGACAITGTGFPIDRHRTSELLGFDAPTGNTYGSIATVDYLLEALSATGVALVGLGRVVQDLLLWCTAELGYLRLGEGYVQASSIMPQKRNPVALEHARALCSKAVGQVQAVFTVVHNTPFGDIVDTEDDLQPLVFRGFHDGTRAVALVAAAMREATFDVDRMERYAGSGWITVTELADELTRGHDLPFRVGHAIAARFVAASVGRETDSPSEILAAASREVLGRPLRYDDAALLEILSARHFVAVRRSDGGPAPDATARALDDVAAAATGDEAWLATAREGLSGAARRLRALADGL